MNFNQLFSGSKGNAYIVEAENGKRLLLECGVSWPKLQKALDYKLDNIEACFVSHEHKDHYKAGNDVRRAGIRICASRGTFGVDKDFQKFGPTFWIIEHNTLVRLKSFEVFAFSIEHDAAEPLGFIVREISSGEYLLFVTDTKTIKQRFKYPFSIVAIEMAYDATELTKRVEAGEVNETYARRLLTSHMERAVTHKYLAERVNREKLREIHLIHISGGNIDKNKLAEEIAKEFMCEIKILDNKIRDNKLC